MIPTTSKLATFRFPTQMAAFGRKLSYAVYHLAKIDSFEPAKRVIDVTFSAAFLTIASPFLLAFALYRKVHGVPVFERTDRIGKWGCRYQQYGLAGAKEHSALQRIPSLLNVLAGHVSLVGPRPVTPGDPVLESNGRARLSVKPGLVSLWWVRQRANVDFDDEATADREYLNSASLLSDFGIAFRALVSVLFLEKREAAPRTVEILGLRIDNRSMAESLEWIADRLAGEGQAMLCFTNAHCANLSWRNTAYRQALLTSDLNLADGVGIRIAGKLKRTPIRQNVNGTDLFPRLCAMLEGTPESIYLLGARPGLAHRVAQWIGQHNPGTRVAGYRDGFFSPGEEIKVAEQIRLSGASVLLVAMGVPRQELWIQRNLEATGVRIAMGVGGLFDLYSGRIPRAPAWMREVGLEWIYRLLQEPGRMWKRYLIGNWSFLARHILYELNLYRPGRQATGG